MAVVAAACGSSSSSNTTTSSTGTTTPSSSGIPSSLSVTAFDVNFTEMPKLSGLVHAGSGMVGVVLPDETSSTRYVDFDAPYLTKAFQMAGYSSSDFKIQNALGVDATQLADAQADITEGAKILIIDPLDSTVGSEIQSYAEQHGVKMISYDRATFTGTDTYYVSFNNYRVGQDIGHGFEACVSSWGITKPEVFELDGGENSDPNAVSFAEGYNSVVWGKASTPLTPGLTNSLGYTLVGDQITPDWTNSTGATIFAQQFTAHPNINATIEANDGLSNVVIGDLKAKGVGPKKVPTTGQDATLQGMEWILENYQCGSVYKPIYEEAQDAVSLATILRAGMTPPAALVNATTVPPHGVTGNTQPASLLTPEWVTTTNMNSTVIKDNFISASALCTAVGDSVCSAAGITP